MRGSRTRVFQSSAGVPQVLVVFEAEDGSECEWLITLSTNGSRYLALLLWCCGADLDGLEVEPRDFADETVATAHLVGRTTWIEVAARPGSEYMEVAPCHEEDVPADVRARVARGSPPGPRPVQPSGENGEPAGPPSAASAMEDPAANPPYDADIPFIPF